MLKKILAFFVWIAILVPAFLMPATVYSANATKFEIIAPTTAVVGEAFDVTVKALDSNNQIATDYRGSIVFTTDWLPDTLPMPGRPIVFTEEDQWEKKFSKWVIFKKPGKNKLFVLDVNSDISGEIIISTEEWRSNNITDSETVTIISPTKDAKIIDSKVIISGTARKNSKLSINLNGSDAGNVVTDDSGTFSKEITGINQENNIVKVSLLDADNNVIGTSEEVKFFKTSESSSIYNLTILPSNEVETSASVTLTVEAVKWLSEVDIELDWSIIKAKETSDGKYSATTSAPLKAGEYPINVTAKTITNQTSTKEKIATLKVKEKVIEEKKEEKPEIKNPSFKNIKTETKDSRVIFTFEVENPPKELATFKITYGSTGAVVTQNIDKIFKEWKFSWYIDNLIPGDYTFKIQWQKADASLIENLVSEPLLATIGVRQCTISNVGKISIKTDTSKSVLTWDKVDKAIAYNIYRVTDGKYSLVQKVNEPKYTIYLSKWAVEYGDFAIKALCDESTESGDYSNASKVQTGPGVMAIFVIISAISAGFILRRRAS